MPYTPPSGGSVVFELSLGGAYSPPDGGAVSFDLALDGLSGAVTFSDSANVSVQAHAATYSLATSSDYALVSVQGHSVSQVSGVVQVADYATVSVGAESGVTLVKTKTTVSSFAGVSVSGHSVLSGMVTAVDYAIVEVTANAPTYALSVSARVDSPYHMPSITLDVAASVTVQAHAAVSTFSAVAAVDAPYGLYEQVAAAVEAGYSQGVAVSVEGGYSLRWAVGQFFEFEHGITVTDPIAVSVESGYAFTVSSVCEAPYSLQSLQSISAYVVSAFNLPSTSGVASCVELPAPFVVAVAGSIDVEYRVTQQAASVVDVTYTMYLLGRVPCPVVGIYSLPGSMLVVVDEAPYLLLGAERIEVTEAHVSTAEGETTWKADVVLSSLSDYAKFKGGDAFSVMVLGDEYSFVVTSKELNRDSPAGYQAKLSGESPVHSLEANDYPTTDYLWDEATSAKTAAEDVLPGVDWQVLDWPILAYRLAGTDVTPVAMVKTLAGAVGAVLESEPDGSYYVRSSFPVPVTAFYDAVPDHVFLETVDIIAVTESYLSGELYNRVVVSDIQQDIADRLSWIPDGVGAYTGVVRANVYPWRLGVSLTHTGDATVAIESVDVTVERFTETVEVYLGQGSVANPIYSVESVVWEATDLGGVVFDQDSSAFTVTGPNVNSVITVTYLSRSLDYRVRTLSGRPTQFLLESAPLN